MRACPTPGAPGRKSQHTRAGRVQFDMSRRTKSANAALTGLGNTRRHHPGRYAAGGIYGRTRLRTVMAHELGHQVNRDIPLGIVVESISTLVGLFLGSAGAAMGAAAFWFPGAGRYRRPACFLLAIGLYGLLTMPLTNAFSRWRESRADGYALRATRNPGAICLGHDAPGQPEPFGCGP